MRRIALEEAFWMPGLAPDSHPFSHLSRRKGDWAEQAQSRLADFEKYRLPEMDEYGVDVQVLSLTSPGLQAQLDTTRAVEDARRVNVFLAEIVGKYPGRFAGLAALPLQDPAAAAAELEYAVTELGLRGALVNDHTLGRYLDDRTFDVVWERLQALRVPLYIHPNAIPADSWKVLSGYPFLAGSSFGWAATVAAHALRLIYGRVFDRFPHVTVILGHMGEFLPFQTSRLDSRHANMDLEDPPDKLPSQYLRDNIMITTSGVCSHSALVAAIDAVGIDNVMFAIDYPYESTAQAVEFLDNAPLARSDLERVAHRNAERVIGL
ncbi:MAG TPA: amidohydrolase family protein [Amycolatopsis sp.]|uniref:amidohydrolase family protein n=1 Tax=Amycolatopsis sp. TaxID=37632 RepID=UPI002B4693E5|nr:amidohydrolase family protein [Amycolatopsis sp.]HJQ48788.1 amidohydrolase family protein [Amycolatopsis sp.]HKS50210.1 amidohydrolase family protein [Amycolatopsis sp.]